MGAGDDGDNDDNDSYFCVLRGSSGRAQATAAPLTGMCSAGTHTHMTIQFLRVDNDTSGCCFFTEPVDNQRFTFSVVLVLWSVCLSFCPILCS